jgi:hypothetical protein
MCAVCDTGTITCCARAVCLWETVRAHRAHTCHPHPEREVRRAPFCVTADFDVFPAVRSDVAQFARCHAASGMTVERFAKNLWAIRKPRLATRA